ncbi:MAG: hypothetical protein ACKVWV_15645 [Planctomycetota bacterium]
MANPRILGIGVLAAIVAAGCHTLPAPTMQPGFDARPVQASTFGTMRNVSVSGDVWLGSYPNASDLALAERRGIKTVVDLSVPGEPDSFDVADACRRLGIRHVALDAGAFESGEHDELDARHVDDVLAELRVPENYPILLVCANGSRAATMFAIHRCMNEGRKLEDAIVEARWAGMKPGSQEELVRAQVARLHEPAPTWPESAAAWLVASAVIRR